MAGFGSDRGEGNGSAGEPGGRHHGYLDGGLWTTVITLDKDTNGLSDGLCWILGIPGAVFGVVGLLWFGVALLSHTTWVPGIKDKKLAAPWAPVLTVAGFAVAFAAYGLSGKIDLSVGERFAIATGGVALASFVVGLVRFDTVKAAASLPIVVLFIALAAWPEGSAQMDDDVQQTLLIAMGTILGITTLGESLQQAATSRANATVKAAEIAARATSGASVTRSKGDLTRTGAN